MLIRLGFRLAVSCDQPTAMITALDIHSDRQADIKWHEAVRTEPAATMRTHVDSFGNRRRRLVAPEGETVLRFDGLVADSGRADVACPGAGEIPVDRLPAEALPFLLGSRYCETDHMSAIAWKLFGDVAPGWPRVQAICDFVHERLSFGYGYARASRTAGQAYEERVGVCRDFAHLAITLCRAMNIPARYATGYLGDINVPADPAPMDFSAWFEAYLEGGWYAFDARHNRPRTGRVVMARGRDATDVPLIHSFGPHRLTHFEVWTHEERVVPARMHTRWSAMREPDQARALLA